MSTPKDEAVPTPKDDAEFEAVFEELLDLLVDSPAADTAADARLGELFALLSAYTPSPQPEGPYSDLQATARLRERIAEAVKARARHPTFGEHKGGLGPTLGMDLLATGREPDR